MLRGDSHEKFLGKFEKQRADHDEFEFLTEYIASTAPLTVRHTVCGNSFQTSATKLLRKKSPYQCPFCLENKTKLIMETQIKKEVEIHGNGHYTLLHDDASKGQHHLTLRHGECGKIFKAYRNNIIVWGVRCPDCTEDERKSKSRLSQEEAENNISESSRGKYKLVSEYEGYSEDVLFLNTETNEEEILTYGGLRHKIKQEFGNSSVAKEDKQKEVREYVEESSDGRYELRSPYKGYNEKILVKDHDTGALDEISYAALRLRIKKHKLRHKMANL